MKKWRNLVTAFVVAGAALVGLGQANEVHAEDGADVVAKSHKERSTSLEEIDTSQRFSRFVITSDYNFTYPDAVRGIYVTGNSAGGEKWKV